MPVEVRCFGDQKVKSGNLTVRGFQLDMTGWNCPKELRSTLGAVQRCVDFNAAGIDAQIVHCHTWYTHWAGILAQRITAFRSSLRCIHWSRCALGNGNS